METLKYEVIADYPFNNHFTVGEVLELRRIEEGHYFCVTKETFDSTPNSKSLMTFDSEYLDKFPNIFKKLH